MRVSKIISKNVKMLFRSRASALVMILAPLIIIVLVGVSFSTTSFNLNIGVYSESFSDMSTSFVEKLRSEEYAITPYTSEQVCIESVKEGLNHACIVFSPDMDIDNQRQNLISFYVDQSKVNIVYLVMSTISTSFGEKTTEISKDLTSIILSSLAETKKGLEVSLSSVKEISDNNKDISGDSESLARSIASLDLREDSRLNPDSMADKVKKEITDLIKDASEIAVEAQEMTEDMRYYTSQVNESSAFSSDINGIVERLEELNETLADGRNKTIKELDTYNGKLKETIDELNSKLKNARTTNEEALRKIDSVKQRASDIEKKVNYLETRIKNMLDSIESIKVTDAENIVSPVATEINTVTKSHTNLSFLFPSLTVILIMFLGLLLPSTLVIMEKNSRASFRIFTTPTKNRLFLAATYLTSMLIIFFQVIVILVVSHFYFKVSLIKSLGNIILVLFIITTFFVILGMLIGYLFNTEEMALLSAVSIGTLFLLTSGIIFPLESMPRYLVEKAKYNPVVLSSELFKRSMLFASDFDSLKSGMGFLILFSILALVTIIIIKKSDVMVKILKKPTRIKAKKDYIITFFDFGERKAKTLPEFIISLQNLSEERYHALSSRSAISDWLSLVYKDNSLAKKAEAAKTKDELIKMLVEELKRIQKHNKHRFK